MKKIATYALLCACILGGYPATAQEERVRWKIDPDYKHASPATVEVWKDRKFGMMIHWGVYSVLGTEATPLQGASAEFIALYRTLYEVFNPTGFDADEWADLAVRAGMEHFVVTTKHPDGFSLWDTKTKTMGLRRSHGAQARPGLGALEQCYIHYSMMDTPYKKDIVGALVQAFRKRGLAAGLYYAHVDWNDPDGRWDQYGSTYDPGYTMESDPEGYMRFINRQREQLRELCTNYGPLVELWFDGFWPSREPFKSNLVEIAKMMRKLQPEVMMNVRGIGPYGDFRSAEGGIPQGPTEPGKHEVLVEYQQTTTWEHVDVLGTGWAYSPNSVYRPMEWIVNTLVDVVAKGGTFMPAISPMSNGKFPPETLERLQHAGDWMRVNGEAIYKTRPWTIYKEGDDIRFTRSKDQKYLYAISLKWPGEKLVLKSVRAVPGSAVRMLGVKANLKWHQDANGLAIEIPEAVAAKKPCKQAYSFKIEPQPYSAKYQ